MTSMLCVMTYVKRHLHQRGAAALVATVGQVPLTSRKFLGVDSRSSVAKSCTRRKSAAGEIFEISLSHKTYFLYKIIDILRFCETLCMPSKYQNSCYDHTCIAMIHNSSSTCLRLQCQSDQHTVQNEYKADTQPHADRQHPSAFVRECTDHAKTTNSRFALVKRSPNSVELTQQCTLLRRWQRQ
jgi:hypothetical protein